MTVYTIQATFARGELSPRLQSRSDIEYYAMALATARNWIVMRQGGLQRRGGFQFIAETKTSSKKSRLFEFEFNVSQAYALEFGDLYIRFFTLGAQVVSGGVPYEIVSPYGENDLAALQIAQSGDTVYIAHPNYAPRKLVRSGETSWAISTVVFADGPYLDEDFEDKQGTTLTPASRGSVTPVMTSNTTPSGTAYDVDGGSDAYKVFDLDNSTKVAMGSIAGQIGYTFPSGTTKVADAYWIVAPNSDPDDVPTEWRFQGYNGSSWITLDSRTGESGFGANERRYYEFDNETAYQAYRFDYSGAGGSDANSARIAELGIHERAENQTPFNLTASSIIGINGGSGFQATDVNRAIRLLGSDGHWRWARIKTVTSTTVVTIQLYGHALTDQAPFARWQLGAWSALTGYPAAVGFYRNRLGFASTPAQPLNLWMSKSADYEDFGVSDDALDTDGITVEMTGGRLNQVAWMEELGDLAIGTVGSIRVVSKDQPDNALSSTNIKQEQQSTVGAMVSQPVIVGSTAIFADRYGKRLYELAYDLQSNAMATQELSILSDHLAAVGIVEIVYAQDPENLILAPLQDGRGLSCTYDKSQKVAGFVPWPLGGTDAKLESAAVIPSSEGDVVYAITSRTINGATKRYVEYLAAALDDGDEVADGVYFDASLSYSGVAANVVTGFTHLVGETVGILADGVDIGDVVVASDGSITLPDSNTASKITAGLRYKSRGMTLRATSAGNRDGTALGRKKVVTNIALDLLASAGIKAGTKWMDDAGKLQPVPPRLATSAPDSAMPLTTGIYDIGTIGRANDDGQVVFETDRGYPAVIRSLIAAIDGEP